MSHALQTFWATVVTFGLDKLIFNTQFSLQQVMKLVSLEIHEVRMVNLRVLMTCCNLPEVRELSRLNITAQH
jgi:hypothetical protein